MSSLLKATAIDWQAPSQDLAEALRVLGNRYRLDILRLLDSGKLTATEIAGALHISVSQARRHVKELVGAGLVESFPSERGQRFALNRSTAALLNASVVSLLARTSSITISNPFLGPEEFLPISIPSPPNRCMNCQNVDFVRGVLEDLERIVAEAREYQSRLQQLSSQVLAAHEAERKRIARELHDDTAQALTSILVRLRLLERSVGNGDIRQSVEELRALTGNTLDSVRRIAVDLRPTALDDLGLVAALHSYVEKFSRRWSIDIEFSTSGLQRRLPTDVELVLYRVVQEALSNVAKHSRASSAKVTLTRKKNVVTATIRDKGAGFLVDEVMASGHSGLGLFGMKERLSLVSGWLQIESSPGNGTRVIARVPLAPWIQRHN